MSLLELSRIALDPLSQDITVRAGDEAGAERDAVVIGLYWLIRHEPAEKIKEHIAKLEEKNAPGKEKLAKINEQLKPIDRELRDLKGEEQKLKQAGHERDRKAQRVEKFISQIQRQVRRLTPRGVGRYADKLNNSLGNLMADRTAAHAPKGSTQARISDDDEPKRKPPGHGLGD